MQDLDRVQRGENSDITWVIYRLTDVLLMQAEAMTMKAMEMGNEITGDTLAARNSLLENAFAIVQTVNSRAKGYNIFPPTDTIPAASYKTNAKQMEELVLKERRRELLFEGKRWFDLVRMARRDGNTERLTQLVLLKYTENVSAVRIKLAAARTSTLFMSGTAALKVMFTYPSGVLPAGGKEISSCTHDTRVTAAPSTATNILNNLFFIALKILR